jgi:hypothetical protein
MMLMHTDGMETTRYNYLIFSICNFYNALKYNKKAITTIVHLYKFFSGLHTIPYVFVNFTFIIGVLDVAL